MSNLKIAKKNLLDAKQQVVFDTLTSTAARVRYLATITTSRGDISRFLDIRYQWVRNVLETPLKTVAKEEVEAATEAKK
jgi:hypothetical protein